MNIKPIIDDDLTDCPFCDNDDVRIERADYDEFHVYCPDCEATGPTRTTPDDAAFSWNKTRYRGK